MKYIKKINALLLLLLIIFTVNLSSTHIVVDAANNDYYATIDNSIKGVNLKLQLRDLITKTHSYMTTYEDCRYPEKINGKTYVNPDQDPNNPNNLILFWSGLSIPAKWDSGHTWNREHVWPKSHSWFHTSLAGSDLHHIRPADPRVNTVHNNKPYGIVGGNDYVATSPENGSVVTDCKNANNAFEPCDNKKGDVARIVFYLLTRYQEADSYKVGPDNVATSIELLLDWNNQDPVDSSEVWRNDAVQKIQGNRNPFIDNQYYADLIWDSNAQVDNAHKVNINYNQDECNVQVVGTKSGTGYKGDVTIKVSMKPNCNFEGIKDITNNKILSTNFEYTIKNINRDYNLEVLTSKETIPTPPTPPTPIEPDIPIVDGTFTLVNSISELHVGDKIIITGEKDETTTVSLSTNQKSNNRGEVVVERNGNVINNKNEIQTITLVKGTKQNTFGFEVLNETNTKGYLYAASSSSNHLKTDSELTDNGSWTIEINNGETTIYSNGISSHNTLNYNKSSSLFSCYLPNKPQQPVKIYKQKQPLSPLLDEFTKLETKSSMYISYAINNNDTNTVYQMNEAGIRFGTVITKQMYDELMKLNATFGVESYKGPNNQFDSNTKSYECIPARVDSPNSNVESKTGNYYQFALLYINMHYQDLDTEITSRVYVQIDGVKYYMKPITYSLRGLAIEYLTQLDKPEILEHKEILEHIRDYH